jgi:hypothetical protein
MSRKDRRAGMHPNKATLRANKKIWDKEISEEREKWLKEQLALARAMDDNALMVLAMTTIGRKKLWQLVKKGLKEKALETE